MMELIDVRLCGILSAPSHICGASLCYIFVKNKDNVIFFLNYDIESVDLFQVDERLWLYCRHSGTKSQL